MLPYFVLFVYLSLVSFSDVINIKRYYRTALIFQISIILILFAGFRYGDQDYRAYQEIFRNAQGWNIKASSDIGYSLLNSFLGSIWNDPLIIFVTMAVIAVNLHVNSFIKYSKYAIVAILFYYVHTYLLREMVQIRSGLACAIGLYNIRNLERSSCAKYWILTAVAMTIHLGAIMFILVWILKQINFSRSWWIFILVICFVIGIVYPFGTLLRNMPRLDFLVRVQDYANREEFDVKLGVLTNLATLKQLFMCCILLLFYKQFKDIKHFDILTSMYFVSTCWLMVWNDFGIIAGRMATFLSIGEPILMSGLFCLVSPNSKPLLLFLLILVAMVFLLTNMHINILPYKLYPLL